MKLICEYELHSLPNKKVSGAKDHGKNYIKVRPPLVRHLLRNRLFSKSVLDVKMRLVVTVELGTEWMPKSDSASNFMPEFQFLGY